jgi:Uma2 family endonuclease
MAMEVQQRVYNVDEFWRFVCQPENEDKRFELISGEIFEMSPPGWEHGTLAGEIYYYFRLFDPERSLGNPTVDTGFYPTDDRSILFSPDVAFTRSERAPERVFKNWAPLMPDIAVEVQSPSNTLRQLRRKAAIYLAHGTELVWIVIPDRRGVEVCRLNADGKLEREFVAEDGAVSGESVLPGFSLKLSTLFA